MKEQQESDPIEKNLPWLTPWFTDPNRTLLQLTDIEEQVASEISNLWPSTAKVDLFDSLGKKFGRQVVCDVIDKVVAAHIQPEWEEVAGNQLSNTMDDLVRLLWEPLPAQGFDVSIDNQTDGIQIHCTRCPHADLGRQIGGSEWLYHLVCSGDPYAAAGFNPNIRFRRSQTLMEGQPCCNHFYFLLD